MLLKEVSVKIPRAIGIGLIIYFGFVIPGREAVPISFNKEPSEIQVPSIPVPPVYVLEVDHE